MFHFLMEKLLKIHDNINRKFAYISFNMFNHSKQTDTHYVCELFHFLKNRGESVWKPDKDQHLGLNFSEF